MISVSPSSATLKYSRSVWPKLNSVSNCKNERRHRRSHIRNVTATHRDGKPAAVNRWKLVAEGVKSTQKGWRKARAAYTEWSYALVRSRTTREWVMVAVDDDIRNYVRWMFDNFFSLHYIGEAEKCGNANSGFRRVTLTQGPPKISRILGTSGPLGSLCECRDALFWCIKFKQLKQKRACWEQKLKLSDPKILYDRRS